MRIVFRMGTYRLVYIIASSSSFDTLPTSPPILGVQRCPHPSSIRRHSTTRSGMTTSCMLPCNLLCATVLMPGLLGCCADLRFPGFMNSEIDENGLALIYIDR